MAIAYNAGTNTITLDGANTYTFQDIFTAVGAAGVFEKQQEQYWSGAHIKLGDGTNATKLIDSNVAFQLGTLAARRRFISYANSEWKMDSSYLAIYSPTSMSEWFYDSLWEFTGCTIVYRGLSYGWYNCGAQTHKDCYFDVCGWVTRDGVGNYDNCVFKLHNSAGDCGGSAEYRASFFYYTEGTINKLTIRDGVTGFFMQAGNAVLKNSLIENCTKEMLIQASHDKYATLIDTQITGAAGKLEFRTNSQYLLDKKSFDLKVTDEDGNAINGATVTIKDKHDKLVSYLDSEANLAEDLTSSETGVDVTDGTKFSVDDVLLVDGEFMKVTNIAGDTLTVTRNFYGSPNYFADIHGNGKDIFIVQALTTNAAGQIPTQLGYYRIFRGTSETETNYSPHTLKITQAGTDYLTYEKKFTLDQKIDWRIAMINVADIVTSLTDIKGTGFVKDTDSLVDIRPETGKIQSVKTETDKIQTGIIDTPNTYKANVSNLDVAVSSRNDVTPPTVGEIKTELETAGSKITLIKTETDKMNFSGNNIQARAADKGVLNNPPSESIADYKDKMSEGELHSGLDSYSNKAGYKDKNTENEIKTAIDNYANKDTYKANVSDLTDILATVKRAVGLIHENYRLFSLVYDGNNLLTSATIKIYPSATDCDNNANVLAEYLLTATYTNQNLASYKVTKV